MNFFERIGLAHGASYLDSTRENYYPDIDLRSDVALDKQAELSPGHEEIDLIDALSPTRVARNVMDIRMDGGTAHSPFYPHV